MTDIPRRLGDYASIRIGYKSLLNDFFYVDAATVARFEIEKEYLTPILKLADLDPDKFVQDAVSAERWVFTCKKEPNDLRGTGAYKYIRWGSKQETNPRKQTERPVPWPEAPALSNAKHWFWPAARQHKTKIAIRKAIGQRYAPFVFSAPTLLDQRLYLVLPRQNVDWEVLAAYLSSSLFALAVETAANLSLGVGYLTFGAHVLQRLPSIDLQALSGDAVASARVREAVRALFSTRPPDASEYRSNKDVRALDEAFLAFLGLPASRAAELQAQVEHFANVRKRLEVLKEAAPSQASAADIDAVSEEIALDLRKWLAARRYPEDFFASKNELHLALPAGPLDVHVDPVLGSCHIRVENSVASVLYEENVPQASAEVILRALQLGRRDVLIPLDDQGAETALTGLDSFLADFDRRFHTAMSATSLGPKYADQVRSTVLKKLNVPLRELRTPFDHGHWHVA
jgi:hypothetical protein